MKKLFFVLAIFMSLLLMSVPVAANGDMDWGWQNSEAHSYATGYFDGTQGYVEGFASANSTVHGASLTAAFTEAKFKAALNSDFNATLDPSSAVAHSHSTMKLKAKAMSVGLAFGQPPIYSEMPMFMGPSNNISLYNEIYALSYVNGGALAINATGDYAFALGSAGGEFYAESWTSSEGPFAMNTLKGKIRGVTNSCVYAVDLGDTSYAGGLVTSHSKVMTNAMYCGEFSETSALGNGLIFATAHESNGGAIAVATGLASFSYAGNGYNYSEGSGVAGTMNYAHTSVNRGTVRIDAISTSGAVAMTHGSHVILR